MEDFLSPSFTVTAVHANGVVTLHAVSFFTPSIYVDNSQQFAQSAEQSETGDSDPLLHLLLPSSSKRDPPPPPVPTSFRARVPHPLFNVFSFQHLWSGSPNKALGFQLKLDIQTFALEEV
ncbi:hypothetical protein AVEN_2740-1 [Araneus ventricosus]|uniref:Uncharacterized protein n=1 Tax=Araneus ventricosus TaxID=182803 RepID=A0A4Y2PCH2_ARAVE|nr:hypothetical protein AVEN_2740-1 [Araneus ventricosus]